MPVDVDPARFEELVGDALDGLPDEIAALLDNVVVVVAEGRDRGLLGLYEGTPRTERGQYGFMEMPDRVTVYRRPLCALAADEDELVHEVRVTVAHELGHHLGIDDTRLHELGFG
ncbi:MAG TPA: metallopeptidase family protein [Acidimicrobiales bacterium]|nr:metallopeptidase family protein [Acidimicrobiales bacterium]